MKVTIYDREYEKRKFTFNSYKQYEEYLGFITEEQFDQLYEYLQNGRYVIVKEK